MSPNTSAALKADAHPTWLGGLAHLPTVPLHARLSAMTLARSIAVSFAGALFSVFLVACGGGPQIRVNVAPGFSGAGHAISVVGVMKDGRLSSLASKSAAAALSKLLDIDSCESVFAERLNREDKALFTSVDRDTRENGMSETTLERFRSRAKGDLILVMEAWGDPPRPGSRPDRVDPVTMAGSPGATAPGGATPGGMAGGMAGSGGMGGMPGASRSPIPKPAAVTEHSEVFGWVVSIYSLKAKEWVVSAKLTELGDEPDKAMEKFAIDLANLLPKSTCGGWKWDIVKE